MSAARPTPPPSLVTLIDGDCALCSGYARFVSRLDARGVVYFETQQSPAGRALLRKAKMPEDLSTIVVIESVDGRPRAHVKSTAVLRTFARLGMPVALLAVFLAVPVLIRDAAYSLVARHRRAIFGTNGGQCALPDAVFRRRIGRPLPPELAP